MRFVPLLALGVLLVGCSSGGASTAGASTGTASETTITPQAIAALMGVPMYPGATAPDDKTMPPSTSPTGEHRVNLALTTKDSPEKVLAFFKKELPKFQSGPINGGLQAIGMSENNAQVIIQITKGGDGTNIQYRAILAK